MDFQTLTRRELQSLCKLNKIPANLTNVAMAEALQSLDTVAGIEEYLNATQSETADVVQSVETVDVLSPKAPQTRCRTSTVTRTTRRGSRQPPKEVEESKNDSLNTPDVSRTTRKVSATSTRRNVSHRLSECETEVKEEVLVENKYSTRRSTRLTEKKATVSRVRKGAEKAVKIDSILDQGNSNAEVEDICNAFKKLDVVVIEEEVNNVKQDSDEASLKISEVVSGSSDHKSVEEAEDCDEVNSLEDPLKNSEVKDGVCDEVSNLEENLNNSEDDVCHLKPESDEVTQTEDENLVQKLEFGDDLKEHNPVMVHEEEQYGENDTSNNVNLESGVDAELELEDTPCADSEMINEVTETYDSSSVVSSMITENQIDEIITKETEEMSENTVGETVDVITMTEEVGDVKPDLFTENNMTPIKKATPFKSMTEEVEDQRFEVFTENNEKFDADSGLAQNQVMGNPGHVTPFKNASGVVSDDKENNVVEVKDIKKDENDKIKNANDMSIRQLKKLLKAMTLDSHNSKEEGDAVGTKRTALQAVCENQMVASGDNKN